MKTTWLHTWIIKSHLIGFFFKFNSINSHPILVIKRTNGYYLGLFFSSLQLFQEHLISLVQQIQISTFLNFPIVGIFLLLSVACMRVQSISIYLMIVASREESFSHESQVGGLKPGTPPPSAQSTLQVVFVGEKRKQFSMFTTLNWNMIKQ